MSPATWPRSSTTRTRSTRAFALVGVRDRRPDHRADPDHLPQPDRRAAADRGGQHRDARSPTAWSRWRARRSTCKVGQDLQTILLIVLFGIGTDYILFLLFRYRERLRAGDDKKTAMVYAVERVGEVITSAAAAVIVAFLVLLLASLGFFGSLGPALAIAVGVMLVTSLTLIPALVSLLGRLRVLAVEGVAAPAEGDDRPPHRRHRRQAVRADRGRLRAAARRARQRRADATRRTTTSAPASRRRPSRPRPPSDLQRGFAAGAARSRPRCTSPAPTARR